MQHRSNFMNGRHIVTARTMAGLTQAELSKLAGIHRNSLQRWENMDQIKGGWALERIEAALRSKHVAVSRSPNIAVSICAG